MSNMTNVLGYFNPNDYSMQIVVSEHNLTLHLKPKEYIVDRNGGVVNDPLLDRYVGKGRLARASGATPRPLIKLIALNQQPAPGQPAPPYQHSVTSASGFYRDPSGQMRPIVATPTEPVATVPPPVSYNPVKALTVEQAKKLRLIKPTRPVNEDAGVEDKGGVPIAGERVPMIDYALDTTKSTVEALPNEALARPLSTDQQAAVKNALVSGITEAARPDFESTKDAVALAMQQAQAQMNMPQPPPLPVAPAPLPSSAPLLEKFSRKAPPLPTNPQPTVMIPVLPSTPAPAQVAQPVLPEPILDDVIVDEELPGTISPASTQTTEDNVVISPPTSAASMPTVCPICKAGFDSSGYLKRHINRKHPVEAHATLYQLGMA